MIVSVCSLISVGIYAELNKVLNIFLGIVFQALPFLLIGVSLSSLIQVFVSRESIERIFPKSLGGGMAVAIFAGFLLPVCDCASIPIFRSLVKKGVPMPAAVSFMTAAPVINPVVMLSTYYAFGGNVTYVIVRVLLGIIAAASVGAIFYFFPVVNWEKSKVHQLESHSELEEGYDAPCSLHCCSHIEQENVGECFVSKIRRTLRHSQSEFFEVGGYLLFGAFVTAVIQTFLSFESFASSGNYALSVVIMMVMAFLLSLCSSSDAVIGKSLAFKFPAGSVMGFLVFGPMMDIKNVILLSGFFSNKFIGRLIFATVSCSFLAVFLLARVLLGV